MLAGLAGSGRMVRAAMADAAGGVLLVDYEPGEGSDEAVEALVALWGSARSSYATWCRGHEVPADVRAAIVELSVRLPRPTVRAAHGFAASLSRTAASRTLALADLGVPMQSGGLTAVG
jgi:hypothetical protein